jgi:predicted CopG family antitoxin
METTTIALTKELKEKISEFGNKGETFSDILQRLYNSAVQRQLHDFLMNDKGDFSIEEARKELNKKWPRSK